MDLIQKAVIGVSSCINISALNGGTLSGEKSNVAKYQQYLCAAHTYLTHVTATLRVPGLGNGVCPVSQAIEAPENDPLARALGGMVDATSMLHGRLGITIMGGKFGVGGSPARSACRSGKPAGVA